MPHEPDHAKEKRPPHRERHNAQDYHEARRTALRSWIRRTPKRW